MKVIATTFLFFICYSSPVFSQGAFGAVGSFWQYTYEAHDGNGQGWEVISVERDTVIDGKTRKILFRTYFNQSFFPPIMTNSGSHFLGTMLIKNDSVFINDNLVLDFTMSQSDTMSLSGLSPDVDIQITVDTITIETIDAIDYKKWTVQKFCIYEEYAEPYETVTILENVGQIDGYLLWNTDGCAIGGGLLKLDCYKNGDFTFPFNAPCDLISTTTVEPSPFDFIKIFPNPIMDYLHIESPKYQINQLTIRDIAGKILIQQNQSAPISKIDLSNLNSGFYILTLLIQDQFFSKKILKY